MSEPDQTLNRDVNTITDLRELQELARANTRILSRNARDLALYSDKDGEAFHKMKNEVTERRKLSRLIVMRKATLESANNQKKAEEEKQKIEGIHRELEIPQIQDSLEEIKKRVTETLDSVDTALRKTRAQNLYTEATILYAYQRALQAAYEVLRRTPKINTEEQSKTWQRFPARNL